MVFFLFTVHALIEQSDEVFRACCCSILYNSKPDTYAEENGQVFLEIERSKIFLQFKNGLFQLLH